MRHTDKTLGLWTRELHRAALNSLQGPGGAALYVHYPIPHGTWIRYDGTPGQFGVGSGFFDTYKTADALLGEIRQALELSGAWDKTLVILTSDHNQAGETSDPRVPLLMKLPMPQQRTDYEGPWTQAQLFPLLERLLQGGALDHEAVMQDLHALAPSGKTP